MVESQPSKLLVAGSIPVSRSSSSGFNQMEWLLAVLFVVVVGVLMVGR